MAGIYFLSYDLNHGKSDDYKKLEDELLKLNAEKVLESVWWLSSEKGPEELGNHFDSFIHRRDRLLIVEASGWLCQNTISWPPPDDE